MIPHSMDYQQVLRELQVSAETGLSCEEVVKRLAEYGENKLQEKKKKPLCSVLPNSSRM